MKVAPDLEALRWIARLSPENCPGGVPADEKGWRDLVNRIVVDVRRVLAEASDGSEASDRSDGSDGSDRSDRSDRSDGSDGSDRSDRSDRSDGSDGSDGVLLPKHGGYRRLKSFQVASLVYDATVIFCDRFVSKRSRTHDQMVQAARSGRQNIAEGSVASGTSRKGELKLTNVAKASLEELLLDYEDFLRQKRLRHWTKNDPEALEVRNRYRNYPPEWFAQERPEDQLLDPYGAADGSPETVANTVLCLVHQAVYLLKQQIAAQEAAFLREGGFTERLYRKRQSYRRRRP